MTITFRDVLHETYMSFAGGWLLGTAAIVGGRAYTIYTSSQQPVHRLFSHLGSSAFRSQLAVAVSVNALANTIVHGIGRAYKCSHKKIVLCSLAVSLSAAAVNGYLTTATSFEAYKHLMASLAILHLGLYFMFGPKPHCHQHQTHHCHNHQHSDEPMPPLVPMHQP